MALNGVELDGIKRVMDVYKAFMAQVDNDKAVAATLTVAFNIVGLEHWLSVDDGGGEQAEE